MEGKMEITRTVPQQMQTAFSSLEAFEAAQRMAGMLCKADFVPQEFKNNIPNSVIALEMAQRLGMNPVAVMQNMYVVHGKPAWSSQFLISCVNACGKFSPMRYEMTGTPGQDNRTCVAWVIERATDERLEGPAVSIGMAKAEGWYQKNGSKWKTMPELMLRYRAATFFTRLYAPELSLGMRTQEEVIDTDAVVINETPSDKAKAVMDKMPKRRSPKNAKAKEIEAKDVSLEEAQKNLEEKREKAESEGGEKEKPEVYSWMCQRYDANPEQVERALAEVELPSLLRIAWQDLDEIMLGKMKEAKRKIVKAMSE